jgi:hypothetical protein
MVNKVRVQQAIDIMERAKAKDSVFMPRYQDNDRLTARSEEELHRCGNKACFAGHVAVSPEFIKEGGFSCERGGPVFLEWYGMDAIEKWLCCSRDLARSLVHGYVTEGGCFCG